MPFDRDKITQHHIDIVQLKARQLAQHHCDADELESQALVVLWDLALAWDENGGATFESYLFKYTQPRLIDWLRKQYGRAPVEGEHSGDRMRFNLGMRSLERLSEQSADTEGEYTPEWLTDPTPGPQQVVEDRDELRRLGEYMADLEPYDQDLLLAPLYVESMKEVAARHGKHQYGFGGSRSYRKTLAAAAIDSPERAVPISYKRKLNPTQPLADALPDTTNREATP